ncbi:uncharacterized protein LOC118348856 [Juglans regia]|uniref:Uncharacterized protein LOC118348856 n=1 Tax=Juglans regia TaxID=51240 RepID=A0A6P9EID8_JUGRE|nr:uncharacterized protein LOC118348856 [Juglans regia]
MADDLEFLYQHLSLSEKEKGEIHVESSLLESNITRGERCLVMSLLTDRYYNREALKNMMRKVWQPACKVPFKDLGSNLFLVEFEDDRDKQRILWEGPWSFDCYLVLLKQLEGNYKGGRLIGNKIGIVEEVDGEQSEVAWGEYLRIRVRVNISQPLMRGITVKLGQFGSVWIRFAYERLPNFCYMCGKLGHQQKDCEINGTQGARDTDQLPFGPWLHVGTTMGRAKDNSGQRRSTFREFSPASSSEMEQ